ncbi:MAG: right-handed parallel beta-helix repeat-containing protein [Phycisphaera sp.]|nr:MAG: right-handed parallel beta-helix repeat-containing protein [Phycisphaera sp.]
MQQLSQTRFVVGVVGAFAVAGGAAADELIVPSPDYRDIAAAVAAASAGDEVVLLDGVYETTADRNITIGVPITIRSASGDASAVVLRGPEGMFPFPTDRAFTINASVTIEDVTFNRFWGDVGGAILVEGADLTVERCVFDGNRTGDEFGCQTRLGGAIAVHGGGSLVVTASTFTGNGAAHPGCAGTGDARGGAIHIDGGALTILDSRFEDNSVSANLSGTGGAIHAQDAIVTLTGCTLVGNRVRGVFVGGGALEVRGGTLAIIGGVVRGNEASGSGDDFASAAGGGIAARTSAALVGVTIEGNTATSEWGSTGGGLLATGPLTAANLAVTGNAVAIDLPCDDPVWESFAAGGGLFIGAAAELAHATITGNTSDCQGGDVAVGDGGSLALRNAIVRGDIDAAVIDALYSNVTGGLPGEGNIDAEPAYADGLRLASGSPGVDAGAVALIPGDAFDLDGDGVFFEPLPLDLDGGPRQADDPATPDTGAGPAPIPDMGAYELAATPCLADFDGDGQLTLFDFLAFQNAFDAGEFRADLDGDGELTIFDFLVFQNAFDAGCE